MTFEPLQTRRLHPEAILPTRAHPDDAGMDIYSLEDVILKPGEGRMARSGVAFALPQGTVGMIADRSSMAKKGIKTAGGIIDAGYRGEVQVVFWNISKDEVRIAKGDRMAQMLILPVQTLAIREVAELDDTSRGAGGFGSSGR